VRVLEASTVTSCDPGPLAGRQADESASAAGEEASSRSSTGRVRASTVADYVLMLPGLTLLALAALLWTPAAAAQPPRFVGTIAAVTAADLPHSYRAGCPVGPSQLRLLRVGYRGFDGRVRVGSIVVRDRVARDVVTVFRRLYAARFPIRRLRKVDAYRGSDDASMAADNTSGFNCRFVSGTRRWSQHAYGEAIDVNPVENPYVQGSRVSPPAGRRYLDRSRARPGMAVDDGVLVRAFEAAGWKWGGRWTGSRDYQHFSTTGR
jgi:D-alanyl-D-alanine carboxypeptidase